MQIRSFQNTCRRAIVVDGAHLKGEYKGNMLVAVGTDGNNQILPIAFAICRSETNENWILFFQKLYESIGEIHGLCVISDRNQGIENACALIFPNAKHGVCGKHVHGNVVQKRGESSKTAKIFFKATKAYTVHTFNMFYELLRAHDLVAWKYVDDIGPEKWSRAHFPGRRYNLMTSNHAESINAVTRHARKMPIMMLMEFYRSIMQQWYFQRRNLGGTCNILH